MSGALGLAGYGSSDDDEEGEGEGAGRGRVAPPVVDEADQAVAREPGREAQSGDAEPRTVRTTPPPPPPPPPPGPALGPAAGPAPGPAPMPEQPAADTRDALAGQAPPSPYSASQLVARTLTMPPVPNFEIPPSPPGSPPPATTAKFARFLQLKKKGNHFNQRLNQSSALRNPGLLAKLMDFAAISDEDQYATPWPKDAAVATKFPDWAYADELVAAHEKIAKKKEDQEKGRGPREALDFVPAKQQGPSAPSSGRPERRGDGRKNRFDDRRRSRSPR